MRTGHDFRSVYATKTYGQTGQLWDNPLFESEHFVALPTLGALIEGWLLIVPRAESICIGALNKPGIEELRRFVDEVANVLMSEYGTLAVFEHGPSSAASTTGCGVDYAHLHLVPTALDLRSGSAEFVPDIYWQPVDSLTYLPKIHRRGQSYLYIEQPYGNQGYIATPDHIPSQLFRRVIAQHIGYPESYDWRSFGGLKLIESGVARLSQPMVRRPQRSG